MDFIPKICVSKKSKHSKSGTSKLSLKSRKQSSFSQSQSYTQDSQVTGGSNNESFSQPMPNLESISETHAEQPTQKFAEFSLDSRYKLRGASKSKGEEEAEKTTFDLSKYPDSSPNVQSPTLAAGYSQRAEEVKPREKTAQKVTFDLSKYPDSPPNLPTLKESTAEEIQVIDLVSTPEEEEEEGMQHSPIKFETQESPKKTLTVVEKESMWQSPMENNEEVKWQSPKKNFHCVEEKQSPKKNKEDLTRHSPMKNISVVEQENEQNVTRQSPKKNETVTWQSPKRTETITWQSPKKNETVTWQSPKKNETVTRQSPKKHETVTWQSPKKSLGPVAEQQSPEKNDKEWSPNKTATQQSPKKNTSSKPDLDKIKLLKASREDGSSAELRESKKSKCSVETSVERSDVKSKFASKLQVFSKPEAKKLTLVEDDADSEKVPESVNESMEHFRDEPDSKEETRVAENQMLAPPSTDKPTEISEELPCPICNKHAGKNRRAHMKSCAVKNYVSTKQLLQAIELQERQAAERRALGLPPSGLQANQKVFVKKKSSSRGASKDAGVELALVLSRSLQEAQEQEELRRVRELIGEQEAFGWQATASQAEMVANTIAPEPQPSTSGAQLLLGPGTDGVVQLSRGSANTARRGRGRNVAGPPPLLLTTKDEERERRITEKVAMLLVGDENSPTSDAAERLPKPPLSSRLKKLQNETTALWSLTSVSPSKKREAFYVTNISEFVSPTKHEPGAALRHLSQIPGRNKTPSKTCEASDMSLCSFVETNAWVTSMDTAPTSPDKYRSGGNALSSAWRGLLNSRTMSDVTVYTRGEHALRAHKLVLYARCPAMLEDIAKELSPGSDRVREQMLLWSDVSRAAALAMLEFVYCDTTERATTLLQEDLEQLTQLARRYRVKELLQHLLMLTKIRTCVGAKEAESPSRNNKFATFPKPLSSPSLTPKKSPGSTSSDSVLRPRSDSPDLFTEGVQEESSVVEYERPDLEYLVSMMEKSQVDVASVQSIKSSLSSPRSVEAKRKCSSSPSVYATSSKKHCKEACRKKLSLEPDEGNQSFHMHVEPSSSQILDLLEKSPSRKFNATMDSEVETFRTAETDEGSPIISDVWDGFDDYGFEPLMPPRLSEARKSLMLAKSPDTVISISSTTVSQNSISPGNVTVRERILDDSLDAFEGIDLSGLERAALTAYAKVVSPLPSSPPPVATPVNQRPPSRQENAVTPMADYSIMESPALERELDKYGIRRLRRNQAKLILRHIYNELHPLVPATPAINSHVSPVSRRGKARAPRARGRRGGTTVSREDRGRKVHDMSLSQPDPARDDDRERTHAHNTSLSQPLADSRSSESDSSASSSDDSGEDEDGLSDLDDDGLDRPGKLETAEEVKETMSRLIVSEPELHHRLLMYEPIMLAELQSLLRKNGKRCNPRLLLDYLDEHCITFRTPRPPRICRQGTQRRKRSPRKASQRGTRGRRPKVRPGDPIT